MKLAIIGSRSFNDRILFSYYMKKFNPSEVVSGGARGADTLGAEWARDNNIPLKLFLPEYKKHGKAAPLVRNKQIINYCDEVVAFWNGESFGTLHAIKYAESVNKKVTIIKFNGK